MDIVLLNIMGSAALASAVIAGIMSQRLSREIAGSVAIRPDPLTGRAQTVTPYGLVAIGASAR